MRDKTMAKASSFLWPAVGSSMTSLTYSVVRAARGRHQSNPAREQIPA
jgi:hypothetical protein